MNEWFEDYANVKRLARWLVKEQDFNASQLLGYFEKPYNWTYEWEEMLESEREKEQLNPSLPS